MLCWTGWKPKSRWKEVERLICCSCWQGLPKAGLWGDISAIQLVGYQMSNEETGDLYLQVYALKRLSGPSLCVPERAQEIMKDIISSLKDCLRWKRGEPSGGGGDPESASTHPSCHCDQTSQGGRQDPSGECELTEARKAHQQALVAAATLEKHIERLSWSTTRMWLEVHHHSQSQDQPRSRFQRQSHRCHRAP